MIFGGILRVSAMALSLVALSSCAMMDSISWNFPGPGNSRILTVDSKQRHLVMYKDPEGYMRFCAEKSPDTFAASSYGLAGLLGFGTGKKEAQFSNSFGATAATIERTQTVNLLRESMYRTCERYASGAIDRDQFLTLAARDHRSMVAVLAIEQLTGVVKPRSTVISGPALSAMLTNGEDLVALTKTYQAERKTAEDNLSAAQTQLAEVDKPVMVGGNQVQACTLDTRPDEVEAAAAFDLCANKKEAVKNAEERLASAKSNEENVLKNLDTLMSGLRAAVQDGESNYGGYASVQRPDEDQLTKIGKTIENIALTAGIDESLMFCVNYLSKPLDRQSESTQEMCNVVVESNAAQDLQQKAEISEFSSTAAQEIFASSLLRRDPVAARNIDILSEQLAAKIEATKPDNLSARFKAFDEAVGEKLGLKALCQGASPKECAKRVRDSRPMVGFGFSRRQDKIAKALSDWKTP